MLKPFLILFACYLPFYLGLLIYLRTRIQGYTVWSHVVSFLAHSPEPWRSIFNGATVLYGALSFVLPVSVLIMIGLKPLGVLGAFFLLATGLATILVGIFPMDRKRNIHQVVGFLAFFFAVMTGIVFAAIFQQAGGFPLLMKIINFAVIGTTLLLAGNIVLRRSNSSLLEWLSVIGTIAWNFLLSISLLTRWL